MKALLIVISSVVVLGLRAQNTYYVDAVAGNDSNEGTTEQTAFQSLQKVNQLVLEPGDVLLFKRGAKWTGTLRPQGSGNEGNRISIGAYGQGAAPVFDAEGEKKETDLMSASIVLYNQEHWEIRDLEVRNFEKGNPEGPSRKAGILVLAKDMGTLRDFYFEDLTISNVNGSLKTRENGGIFFSVIADEVPEKRVPSNFDGVHINRCYFVNVDRVGLSNQSFWRRRDRHSTFGEPYAEGKVNNWYPSHRILVENCKFENVGGNGLVVRVAESPLVQGNLFVRCSLNTTGNASYPYNCNNALWQFNEACYTVYNEGDVDASGFDSDYLCKNTLFQYNYSHHNDWGGLLVCSWGQVKGSFNHGTRVRENVFQDEKHHMIRFSGNITATEITNNLFIANAQIDDVMLWYKEWGGPWPDKTLLKQNIFVNRGSMSFLRLGETTRNSISDNFLVGNSFPDFTAFKAVQPDERFESSVEKIREIGARKDLSKSRAREVIELMGEAANSVWSQEK